ncbi:DUF2207 family protein [Streptococcus dentasini]
MRNKFLFCLSLLIPLIIFASKIQADDEVDYSISRYEGRLNIRKDNTATFTQVITYKFDSAYKGQYVTLGSAGNNPKGFSIDKSKVTSWVENNREVKRKPKAHLESLKEGYALKIYNAGQKGDQVRVTVTWQLNHILTVHRDIAELNWKPVSDWDVPLRHVSFKISAPSSSQQQLFVHLGYLQPAARIKNMGNTFGVDADYIGEGKALELHGYWDSNSFTAKKDDRKLVLGQFQSVEKKIHRKSLLFRRVFSVVFPVVISAAALIAVCVFILYKLLLKPRSTYQGAKWLYAAPADWSPQLVASAVYSTDWSEVNPVTGGKGLFSFENLVQATLLDLIDRGNLKLKVDEKGAWLSYMTSKGLTPSEEYFIHMAMGEHLDSKLAVEGLFSDYKVDRSISVKKGYNASQVNDYGRRKTSAFTRSLKKLTQAVADEKQIYRLGDYYRPLSLRENGLRQLSLALLLGASLFSVVSLLYLLISGKLTLLNWQLSLGYVLLSLGSLLLWILFNAFSRLEKQNGVLKEEFLPDYYAWQAFRRMMKDIKTFNQAELESIVVWNRILVYATLFGYAKEVEEVIRVHRIEVPSAMAGYVYHDWYPLLYLSAHHFADYGHQAVAAQNFHVSSGGFSSGGFSGGGGGGGGGAF